MPARVEISAAWERLSEGAAEEVASFGLLKMAINDLLLTEGQDTFVNRLRDGPLVSNYHCAEWLAWNWWRLRWEPRTNADDWAMAHKMSSIGQGYVWPNITIYSDGERIVLNAKPTSDRRDTSFRYICDGVAVTRANEFESAIFAYVDQIISQLRAERVVETNLELLWTELQTELRDPQISIRRRLEALMGCEPGEAGDEQIDGLIADAAYLGVAATAELAAHSGISGHLLSAIDLKEAAIAKGIKAHPKDAARLNADVELPHIGFAPAWRRGIAAAEALRAQERLGEDAISNQQLEDLAGVIGGAVANHDRRGKHLSFALDDGFDSYVVLRSRWTTGRRFELARLIGDRATTRHDEKLRPATRACTYRQQMQRAFAAEFLCPFESLYETLGQDYSSEAIEDAAHIFEVSERTVRTLLVNHKCIDRDQLEGDIESDIAA